MRIARRLARVAAVVAVVWFALVAATSPWHRFAGSRRSELSLALPGDAPIATPTFWIQHAVSIDATPDRVWPWIAQLGTDRGGFYSHAWLENLFGIRVANADRIHPEWQTLQEGGFVLATPTGWMGLDHPLGWTITQVEPGRVLVLKDWGAFVLLPDGAKSTRFLVRTRGGQPASPAAFAFAWLSLGLFEPVHFVMERAMMDGIRQRAESMRAAAHP